MTRRITVARETWPLARAFAISRGSRTETHVLVVTIEEDGPRGLARGRGECLPYGRYGETVDSVAAQVEGCRHALERGLDREALQAALPAGAARNAVDCALWDLEAKLTGRTVAEIAGLAAPGPVTTVLTLGVDTPDAMAEAAAEARARPMLKLKLAGDGFDIERVAAVRAAAPASRLLVDANEGWSPRQLESGLAALAALGVEMVEQPLPAAEDGALARLGSPVPIGADESVHTRADLQRLRELYHVVNIKLDKTGGLTEALALKAEAQALGFEIMVGCMIGTSLAMAPAVLVAQEAAFVDLDGPLLLARDREPGLVFDGSTIRPPDSALWG